ncbi:MAG: hypothetical protein M1120_04000 [Patescibacteria group bacterium]|nr:hypothetical protein [Patescibacteria group bacterium]
MAFSKAKSVEAATTSVYNQLIGRMPEEKIRSIIPIVEGIANSISRNESRDLKPKLGMPKIVRIKRELSF